MRFLLKLCIALPLLACHTIEPINIDAPHGPDDWKALRDSFRQVVVHARQKDREAVLRDLEKYLLTRADMVELFGMEVGERVWRGYRDTIIVELRKEAPDVIIERVAEGLEEVEIDRLGPRRPAYTTRGDAAMLEAMLHKRPMFNVRLKRPDDPLGFRLDGFFYMDGRWCSLMKSYRYLEAPDAAPPPPSTAPASDAGAGPNR